MRNPISFAAATLMLIVTGCGSQTHPSFSAFQKVPASQLSTLKTDLQESPIKKIELPTKLPFTVSQVRLQSSVSDMKQTQSVPIFLSGGNHVITIEAFPDAKDTPPNTTNTIMNNEHVTKLSDGTKAIYGNNGRASMLDWAKDGAQYNLASTNTQSKPDLTEKQLIQVADSFK